jgi:hypothetical protein
VLHLRHNSSMPTIFKYRCCSKVCRMCRVDSRMPIWIQI